MKRFVTVFVATTLIGLPSWLQADDTVYSGTPDAAFYSGLATYPGFAQIRFAHQDRNNGLSIDPYSLRTPSRLPAADSGMRIISELGFGEDDSRLTIPVYMGQAWDKVWGGSRYSGLGISWQHRLNPDRSITLSAQYGDNSFFNQPSQDTTNTQAALIWSTRWQGNYSPSLSGGVIIGGDRPQAAENIYLERNYYGLIVGGKMTLFARHTPYISLSMLRNNYSVNDPAYRFPRVIDYTRLSAGWNWRVLPNLQLRADTYYNLDESGYGNFPTERSRITFSTTFTFK